MDRDGLALSLSLEIGIKSQTTFEQISKRNTGCGGRNASYSTELSSRTEAHRRDWGPSSRVIDVNVLPGTAEGEDEEETAVSSPNNSTVSSLSPGGRKINKRDGDYNDDEEGGRKKLRLSKDQSAILEDKFKEHNTLNPKQKLALARQLNLRPRQVEVWFQNRRARTKLKQTEVDCEFLKRCCENLTEENRRLQRELLEHRALKHPKQFYKQMPPTTLTMCPSCERVSVSDNRPPTVISPWHAANNKLDRPQIRS